MDSCTARHLPRAQDHCAAQLAALTPWDEDQGGEVLQCFGEAARLMAAEQCMAGAGERAGDGGRPRRRAGEADSRGR